MKQDRAKAFAGTMFNRIAPDYESTFAGRHSRTMKLAALAHLGADVRGALLDVGCGPGLLLEILAQGFPDLQLSGIDLAPEMVRIATERMGGRADIRSGDAEHLPWPEASFDYVVCVDSFHHYPNARKVLAEFHRVLRPRGQVLLAEPTMPPGLRQLMNLTIRLAGMGDVQAYDRRGITTLLEACDFKSVGWQAVGLWGFVASSVV